ncbi:MAG: tetratricopeptide repeat protein [Pseudomonadota bacterium]
MPILGLVHILIALYFAVHAVRTGRPLYWLFLLFMAPGLGSVVYFFGVYLPQSRLERSLLKAGSIVRDKLDPGREIRDAQAAFDLTPTAHNQVRLAKALLEAGQHRAAVEQYEACMNGPFKGDPEICFGAAQALVADGQGARAIELLLDVRAKHPSFREEQLALVLARAFAGAGRQAEAGATFAALVERSNGLEARVEYALWALAQNMQQVAQAQITEINHARKHMNKSSLSFYGDLFKRLDSAQARPVA